MKTDYTITPEYTRAMNMVWRYRYEASLQNSVGRETPEQLEFLRKGMTQTAREEDIRGMESSNQFSGSPVISNPTFRQAQADRNEYFNLLLGAVDRHDPTQAREPLIRTVCKIAARILFVLLLVGMGVGVMLK